MEARESFLESRLVSLRRTLIGAFLDAQASIAPTHVIYPCNLSGSLLCHREKKKL